MSEIDFQKALARLRLEFIDDSAERLDRIDAQIDRMYRGTGDGNDVFIEFQRDIHSLKGSAGTYGFSAVTLIAHRLEDYIEASPLLKNEHLLDVQAYIDHIRKILESGNDAPKEQLEKILASLPSSVVTKSQQTEHRKVTVFLVMPKGVQRKMITTELNSCGFELVFSDHPLEAFGLAISLQPDLILSSVEFDRFSGMEFARALRVVNATNDIPIVLLTSYDAQKLQLGEIPANTKIVHKGSDFTADLANILMQEGMIG